MAVVAVFAYGWLVTGLPPFSTVATVAVIGSGALVALESGRHRRVIRPARDDVVTPRAAAAWALLAATVAAWQVAALVQHPRVDHPTLSSLANDMLEPRPLRTVAFVGWLAGMAWIARR